MKPIFSANHHWAMAKGEESLRLELRRLHARTPDERATIPAPPQATTISPLASIVGTIALVAVIAGCGYAFIKMMSNVLAN